MKRLSKGAYWLLQKMRAIAKYNGWLKISLKRIMQWAGVSKRTASRWVRELKMDQRISQERRGRGACAYTVLSTRNVYSKPVYIRKELREVAPTEKQHHRDEVADPIEETARKAVGLERLSEGDRAWLKSIPAPTEQIRAGIILGRARKLVQGGPIYSLRYFAATIAEAARLPAEYIEHCARFLERHIPRKPPASRGGQELQESRSVR